MRFIQMKVAHRLAWVFAAILALVVGSSWLSLRALSDANEEMRFAVQDAGERTRLLNEMSDDIGTVARVLRSIALLAGEPTRQAQERTKLLEARKNYDEAWAALQKFPPVQDEEARLREAIAAAAAQTRGLNDQVLALGLADKPHEAIELLLGQAGPASDRWEKALEATMALQRQLNAQRYEHAVADYEHMRWQLGGAILAVVLVSVGLGWRVTRSITRQLGGEPAEAQRVAAAVAHGDFSLPITLRPGDTDSIMAELREMQQALSQVILDVRHGAEHVAVASQQIAQGNVDLSQRTEEQATALQQTAATVGAFDEMVQHAAGGAAQAHQLAHGASEVALKGGAVVNQVVDTMRGINDSSKRIGDIIGVIDGIAFQTNILALNAAVEAARAGEQGRGFAVVASEVRALAQRSAGAAREIKDLISSSVERVEQGSALVDQAGDTMREVVDSIGRVTEIMARLSEASAQQTANMTQVAAAITQMDQATQQNASLVEETASASESMRQQSAQLVERVKVFTLAA